MDLQSLTFAMLLLTYFALFQLMINWDLRNRCYVYSGNKYGNNYGYSPWDSLWNTKVQFTTYVEVQIIDIDKWLDHHVY